MKNLTYYIFLFFLLTVFTPILLIITYKPRVNPEENFKNNISTIKVIDKINVYLHNKDLVIPISFEEYIKGVVAAEMPASFEIEALKAQAIAARTYTLYKINNSNAEIKKIHYNADICTDSTHCQAWKDREDLKNIWGTLMYFKYWHKISRAVNETKSLVVIYDRKLIDPLYHSTSGGMTENSEDVFSTTLPYLRSVESFGEENSPRFYGKRKITFNEFKSKLNSIASGIVMSKDDVKNIKIIERTESGRIKTIKIGNKTFSGKQIRSCFLLNSTNFQINLNSNNIIFETIGYGHGVGMSQYGANYLAKLGENFEYILKHYYKGVDIVMLSQEE